MSVEVREGRLNTLEITDEGVKFYSHSLPGHKLVEWPNEPASRAILQKIYALSEAERLDGEASKLLWEQYNALPPDYGVADSIEQVLEKYDWFEKSERMFVIFYEKLTPTTHPGWRWHKNGEYIGVQEPAHEHLGDEPVITEVISWQAVEIVPDPSGDSD